MVTDASRAWASALVLMAVVFVMMTEPCTAFVRIPASSSGSSSSSSSSAAKARYPWRGVMLAAATELRSMSPAPAAQAPFLPPTSTTSKRIQNIKDISLYKEVLKDVTASEFALQLEVKTSRENAKIDYEMLIAKLRQHAEMLTARGPAADATLIARIEATTERLVELDRSLAEAGAGATGSGGSSSSSSSSNSVKAVADPATPDLLKEAADAMDTKRVRELKESLRVIVREDGSVDWDGATAAGKEVAKFGTELWERLNGKEEGVPSLAELVRDAGKRRPLLQGQTSAEPSLLTCGLSVRPLLLLSGGTRAGAGARDRGNPAPVAGRGARAGQLGGGAAGPGRAQKPPAAGTQGRAADQRRRHR